MFVTLSPCFDIRHPISSIVLPFSCPLMPLAQSLSIVAIRTARLPCLRLITCLPHLVIQLLLLARLDQRALVLFSPWAPDVLAPTKIVRHESADGSHLTLSVVRGSRVSLSTQILCTPLDPSLFSPPRCVVRPSLRECFPA
jgi:hypothetical protein